MNEIMNINTEQTMSSLQIAELTGKRHDAVLRDIRNLLEQGVAAHNFVASEYTDRTGRSLPCYNLAKTGCLILASGYNALLREKIINRWVELETAVRMPQQNMSLSYAQTQLFLADAIADRLRLNDVSRLEMYQTLAEQYDLKLPSYVQSKGVLKSTKTLLKEIGSDMSAIKFNVLLEKNGYIVQMTRPSTNGKEKKFWNITDKGSGYGENQVNPKNPKETQPGWYADKFRELYNLVTQSDE